MTSPENGYAEALFALAAEKGKCEAYCDALKQASRTLDEFPDYGKILSSPAIPVRERIAALQETFGEELPEHVLSFLCLLCENGLIRLLPDCIRAYEGLMQAMAGQTVAAVTSAVEMDRDQREKLICKLEEISGKQVEATFLVDPALIGGVKVEIDGKTYDGTLRGRLRTVKDVMGK